MIKKWNRGLSLVETLVYLAVVVSTSILVVNLLLIIVGSFNAFRYNRNIGSAATTALSRLAREIRLANRATINEGFGSIGGVLTLETVDVAGQPTLVEFRVLADNLVVRESSTGPWEPLVPDYISIPGLTFKKITTPVGEAVKTEITLAETRGPNPPTAKFYITAGLRNSY